LHTDPIGFAPTKITWADEIDGFEQRSNAHTHFGGAIQDIDVFEGELGETLVERRFTTGTKDGQEEQRGCQGQRRRPLGDVQTFFAGNDVDDDSGDEPRSAKTPVHKADQPDDAHDGDKAKAFLRSTGGGDAQADERNGDAGAEESGIGLGAQAESFGVSEAEISEGVQANQADDEHNDSGGE